MSDRWDEAYDLTVKADAMLAANQWQAVEFGKQWPQIVGVNYETKPATGAYFGRSMILRGIQRPGDLVVSIAPQWARDRFAALAAHWRRVELEAEELYARSQQLLDEDRKANRAARKARS